MDKQRTLILNSTPAETQLRLKLQFSPYLLGGIVEESYFKIPKRPTGLMRGRGSLPSTFTFVGDYQPCGDGTRLTYQVRSGLSAFIVYPLLSLLALYMLYRVVFMQEPLVSAIFPLVFLLCYYLIKRLEKTICIADFEKQLTAQIHRQL